MVDASDLTPNAFNILSERMLRRTFGRRCHFISARLAASRLQMRRGRTIRHFRRDPVNLPCWHGLRCVLNDVRPATD